MYPDTHFVSIGGTPLLDSIKDEHWLKSDFITNVQKRGSEIINATGKSSSASAAVAACDHIHDWWYGTQKNEYVSMGVISEKSCYGVDENLCFSFPCEIGQNGEWQIVDNLDLNDFQKEKIKNSEDELKNEREIAFEGK